MARKKVKTKAGKTTVRKAAKPSPRKKGVRRTAASKAGNAQPKASTASGAPPIDLLRSWSSSRYTRR